MDLKKNIIDFIKIAGLVIAAIWTVTQINEASVQKAISLENRLTRIETILIEMRNKP